MFRERVWTRVELSGDHDDGRDVVTVWRNEEGWNLSPVEARRLLQQLGEVVGRLSICEPCELRCGGRR